MAQINILLVDDHQIVRQGIRSLLETEPSFKVVGEAGDAESAIDLITRTSPDVVLLDINLPGMSGLDLARLIRTRFPDIRILVLTMHSAEEYVRAMLLAGADGYLLKQSSAKELVEGIRIVSSDRLFFPRMSKALDSVSTVESTADSRPVEKLTDREKEILRHIALGNTSREIAKTIFLSTKTVENYRTRILSKLGTRNVAEAVGFALQKGMISLDSAAKGLPVDFI